MIRGRPSAEQGPEYEEHCHENAGADKQNVGGAALVRPSGVHSHQVSIVASMRTRTFRRLATVLAVVLTAVSCAGSPPEVPAGPDGLPDPVLVVGRDVFGARCASCHGSGGGGGTGPRLAGKVLEDYPDAADQAVVIADGRQSMPAFGGTLSDEEIEAVVRYTREVLS
jgi:mono/diheme cytochrome c family protein